jgi:DeoR/GlpR family transcriptional regulator of sugar metabolism
MAAIRRLKQIEEMVRDEAFLTISEIAQRMNVSESTIRRDITHLEDRKVVLRSHGGVLPLNPSDSSLFNLVSYREKSNVDIKKKLGRAAAELIEEGDIIFLDSSTTILEVAKNIKAHNITIVTNDLMIALELENHSAINTIILGGSLRQGTHSMIGPIAENNINGMYFSKVFISPGAISSDGYITHFNLQAVELRKKVIAASEKLIIVADNTKFNKKGFVTAAELSQVAAIVTNEIPQNFKSILTDDIQVVITD